MAVAVIAVAQLLGTSLWFSANGAADDLMRAWGITATDIGWLTGAVQIGFIAGTLGIALGGTADRFAASRIFVVCAVLGALFNAAFAYGPHGLAPAIGFRFLVGLALAGIYPLGMKLIIGWAPHHAGLALALLVGMLTLGTALPHGMRLAGSVWPWQQVIVASSLLALVAAVMVGLLGDGPGAAPRRRSTIAPLAEIRAAFRAPPLRAAALGYFGHMWELYAFWTLVPLLVARTGLDRQGGWGGVSGLAFAIIAIGALGCFAGGALSRRYGSARVAAVALALSGACCALFGAFAGTLAPTALLILLLVWGASVVADSPQFSALSAAACPPQLVASVLAVQNSIGFAITVLAIAASTALLDAWQLHIAWLLLPGPVIGLIGLYPAWRRPMRS